MFRLGRVLKVKVELAPNVVGFGRATIVETDGGHIFLQFKTSRGAKRILPNGTRVWFVSDSIDNPFNGLWFTTVVGVKLVGGKPTFECARPKFEAGVQKRRQNRVGVSAGVRILGEQFEGLKISTRNLSKSGVGIEVSEDCLDVFIAGHYIDCIIESSSGPIEFRARVIQPHYNWLANRTEIGLEFVLIEPDAAEKLDQFLLQHGGQPRIAPDGKEKVAGAAQGALHSWLKSTKDNIQFVRTSEGQSTSVLSEDEFDDFEDVEESDADEKSSEPDIPHSER